MEKAENKLKLVDLINALSESKIQISQMKDLMIEQNDVIKELENKLKQKEDIFYNGKVYESKNNSNDIFCPSCYDSKQNQIILTVLKNGILHCKICESNYH